jgi:hypothetical protein
MPLPYPPLEPMATASSPTARRGATGKQARGICNWAHPLPIGSGGLTKGVAAERQRRAGGGAAAGTRIPARTGAELVHVLHGKLHGGLGDVLRSLVYSGDERGAEPIDGCPAAAAGALTPVRRRLGQANKRAQELLGVLVE